MYKTDLEALLRDRNIIRIKPQGYSMYPLFIPGRDEALIQEVPVSSLRRNDVILYRRDQSILVLHRIARITPEGLFLVGDNQSELEGPGSRKAHRLCEERKRDSRLQSPLPPALLPLALYASGPPSLL